MDVKKYCIVCGCENFSRSKMFCSTKCKQHYYYQKNKEELTEYKKEYYLNNKEEYKDRSTEWFKNNRSKWNNYVRKYNQKKREENKENGENN